MRKTPRSSFMVGRRGMGAAVATVVEETPPIISPPFNPGAIIIPSGVMPMTPAPTTPVSSSGLTRYVLWGGLAYLAYWLWSKE
jgi:hypothetical protein